MMTFKSSKEDLETRSLLSRSFKFAVNLLYLYLEGEDYDIKIDKWIPNKLWIKIFYINKCKENVLADNKRCLKKMIGLA